MQRLTSGYVSRYRANVKGFGVLVSIRNVTPTSDWDGLCDVVISPPSESRMPDGLDRLTSMYLRGLEISNKGCLYGGHTLLRDVRARDYKQTEYARKLLWKLKIAQELPLVVRRAAHSLRQPEAEEVTPAPQQIYVREPAAAEDDSFEMSFE